MGSIVNQYLKHLILPISVIKEKELLIPKEGSLLTTFFRSRYGFMSKGTVLITYSMVSN